MNTPTTAVCAYEQTRELRIKENRERMQKLGILDLSSNLKSLCKPKRIQKPKSDRKPRTAMIPTPARRSSRLQNVTPISYSEVRPGKKDGSLLCDERLILRDYGPRPEVYTEEHEKLLGNTKRSWTLFVDGYGKDGRRIYDPLKGKTCHQCRQKTLGHRTHCNRCNMVQGQFCGDCLYMRYGEHVLEAVENPDWICPVCRGICNCSLCRQSKGWAPTGSLYRKILGLGYKSVAHYLIQTKRAQKKNKDDLDSTTQVSAKRTLAFSDMAKSAPTKKNDSESLKLEAEDQVSGMFNNEMEGKSSLGSANKVSVKRSLTLSDAEAPFENLIVRSVDAGFKSGELDAHSIDIEKGENEKSSDKISILDNTSPKSEVEKENRYSVEEKGIALDAHSIEGENGENEKSSDKVNILDNSPPKSEVDKEKKGHSVEEKGTALGTHSTEGENGENENSSDKISILDNTSPKNEVGKEKNSHSVEEKSIADDKASNVSPNLKKKRSFAVEPSPDSIAGRLRQRQRTNKA